MGTHRYRYFNRELSWIEFNARVLEEAVDERNQLLDRLKFAGIVSSNFDEFFMIRVAGLKRLIAGNKPSACPTRMTPDQQLKKIRARVNEIVRSQQKLLEEQLVPGLADAGVSLVTGTNPATEHQRHAHDFFQNEIFPVLTPLRVEDGFPFVENLTLHLLVALESDSDDGERVHALVRIPSSLDRFVGLPSDPEQETYITAETVVAENIGRLFPGYRRLASLLFRVTRDADLGVDEERDEDFLSAMEEVLMNRQRSLPVRLETAGVQDAEQKGLRDVLIERLGLSEEDVYEHDFLLDPSALIDFCLGLDRPQLRPEPWPMVQPDFMQHDADLFDVIRKGDRVLHHPYESFEPVIKLIQDAAVDDRVLAIKITLYRTSGNSPVILALQEAAERGVQVTAFVELKARFDEERNISWAQTLEQVGVIVVHGIANLKVHAKACMIIRRDQDGIRRYVHLSTGNYNDRTARLYSDIGLLTANNEIANDVAAFFNSITGYSSIPVLTRLAMAPTALKSRIIELIQRETARKRETGTGRILIKLNSVADTDVIDALYDASAAGVEIRMNVRGICMLVPGVEGVSEHIEVYSIVDRYLEHSRILYFENGGNPELYLSSADWMPRNLERRVELMFPVVDPTGRSRIIDILSTYFRDTEKARKLLPDGTYRYVESAEGEPIRAQETLYREAAMRSESVSPSVQKEFTVRRSRKA